MSASSELFQGSRTLLTTHREEDYPGLLVVQAAPSWGEVRVIVPDPGQCVLARGGERCYGYQTTRGARADGFVLNAGDRATLLHRDLAQSMAQWQVERASSD